MMTRKISMENIGQDGLSKVLKQIAAEGTAYGRCGAGDGKKVQVEYVSANPNGPITLAHGRGAAIGDTIANLLAACGYNVTRETYVNDAPNSTQMQNLAKSVYARYKQALGCDYDMPADGYQGRYVVDIADEIVKEYGDKWLDIPVEECAAAFIKMSESKMLELQKSDMARFGVEFDIWFSEASLHDSGKVDQVIGKLKASGHAYEKAGGLWLKSTAFGDDADRTLIRDNGQTTYIAADTAYHYDKFQRGFDMVIDCWGPDHGGYIARTKAALAALGLDPEKLEVIIYQTVRLLSGGEIVTMSKRVGEQPVLSDLIDEVGKDRVRLAFLSQDSDQPLDFDLEVAKSQLSDNPLYCVQSAYEKLSDMLDEAKSANMGIPDLADTDVSVLTSEAEIELAAMLAELPDAVQDAADKREPHRLVEYVLSLSDACRKYCAECRIVVDNEDVTGARMVMASSAIVVLNNALCLLGISLPEKKQQS